MHEHTTYQSCTDYRRSTADATWRLTLSPITQHLPFKVRTNLRQKTNHIETTNGLTVTSTQVSLTMEQPGFTQVPLDLEDAMPPNHQTPTTSSLPEAPRYMFAHWAPLSDDTKTTRATFQQWVFTVPALLIDETAFRHNGIVALTDTGPLASFPFRTIVISLLAKVT